MTKCERGCVDDLTKCFHASLFAPCSHLEMKRPICPPVHVLSLTIGAVVSHNPLSCSW